MAAVKENFKENSRENFDPIWSFIEDKLKESVPNYIKYVLSYCGYNTGISIASIEGEDINYCVKEVRSGNVTTFYKSKFGDKDILEGCNKTWDNFEFSRGHLKYLMDIVAILEKCIEENGVDCFQAKLSKKPLKKKAQNIKPEKFKRKTKYSTVTKNTSLVLEPYHKQQTSKNNDTETSIEKHMRILAKKMLRSLRNHTPVLYLQIANNINNKMTELITVKEPSVKKLCENKQLHEEMTARKPENISEKLTKENSEGFIEKSSEELAEEDSENPTASMLCPYCWKSINVFFVANFGSPNWNSSNFDRHLKLIHCTQDTEATENDSECEDESQCARGGIKNLVACGDNKDENIRDRQTRDADVITDNDTKNETQDVHAFDKIQVARDGNKIKVVRVSNQGQDTNKGKKYQGSRAGTKNQVAHGANKDETARDRDADIITNNDTRNEIQGACAVGKIPEARGNKTKATRVSNKGQDNNIGKESQGARGCTKNQVTRCGKNAEDGIKTQGARASNTTRENLKFSRKLLFDWNCSDANLEYEGTKEPLIKSITKKSKEARKQILKVSNGAFEGKDSVDILPNKGDYIICSKSIENSEKWPEDTPFVKNFVGGVTRIKDTMQEDAAGNSLIPGEIELQFLKKHPHAKHIFINPDAISINTIAKNRILKILQAPSQNRRGDFVFKDKAILDYIF